MSHLYEVTTSSGSSFMINANNSQDAKEKLCKQMDLKREDPWTGVSSIKAKRIIVDYPEVNYRPLPYEEVLLQYVGKDIVIYDEHHGTATRIKKSTVTSLQYYLDEYSTIIVLE